MFMRGWSRSLWVALAVLVWAGPALADLPATLSRIKPSIVAVGTFLPTRSPAFEFRGTGFVVDDGLTVATNAHVLPAVLDVEKRESIAIAVPGTGKVVIRSAVRIASDPAHDVALLKLQGGDVLPTVRLNDRPAQEGESVALTGFPIGSALGLRPVTHRGIVSAVTPISIPRGNARELNARQIHSLANNAFEVYQLDATAYPGNSGSPLYDQETGDVIGVLNMVFVKETKENVLAKPSGISYAIPIRYLIDLLNSR